MRSRSDKKRIFNTAYLSGVFILCALSVVLCILGLCHVIEIEDQPYYSIDLAITAIFWVEYLIRFITSKKKGEYFKETFIELISILPFSPEFALLHAIRLLRFVRLVRIFPSLPFKFTRKMNRIRNLCREFFNSKGLAFVLMGCAIALITTVFCLDRVLTLPYFQALKVTAVSCFSLSTAPKQAQIAAFVVFAIVGLGVFWLIFSSVCFSKRLHRVKKGVIRMMKRQEATA